MPLVLGILVLMSLVGLIALELAFRGKTNSATRQSANAGFYVAESGVSRTLSLLKTFPELAQENLSDWSTAYSGATECISDSKSSHQNFVDTSSQIEREDRWIAIDAADVSLGEFRILDYTYDAGTGEGELLIEGRRFSESAGAVSAVGNTEVATNNSVSAIRSVINVNDSVATLGGAIPFLPSLWVANTNFTPVLSEQPNNNGGWLISSNAGSSNGCPGGASGPLNLRNLTASDVSGVTNTTDIITTRETNGNPIQISENMGMPSLPSLPPNLNTLNGIVYDSGDMNEILSFPRNGDKDEKGKVYNGPGTSYGRFHYWVKMRDEANCDSDEGFPLSLPNTIPAIDSDCNSIDLTIQNTQLQVVGGQKVTFYLQGNLNLRNSSKIVHESSNWTNLQIYGNRNGLYGSEKTKILNFSSESTFNVDLFLFAPEAILVAAGNDSKSNINHGMVWVKEFGAGNQVTTHGNDSEPLLLPNGTSVRSYPLTKLNQLPAEIANFNGAEARLGVGGLENWQREQTQ